MAGRTATVLDDGTPLDGEHIDVAVRTGWVLRIARLTSGRAERLGDMVGLLAADGTVTSPATLHRLETGRLRDGRLVEAYERALGRDHGSLRAPLDAFARTFPYGPADRDPGPEAADLATTDRLAAPLLAGSATGNQWLAWARTASAPGAGGLPSALARPWVARLTSELRRSWGEGYLTRYEALSLLRRGPYGAVVLDVARDVVAEDDPQVVLDVMSAVGESATDGVAGWLVGLLDHQHDHVVAGAVVGLESLAATSSGPVVWRGALSALVTAYNGREPGSEAWHWYSHVVRLLPRGPRTLALAALAHPPAPAPVVSSWSRSRLNEHWSAAEAQAERISDDAGLPEQPLLARLLLELTVEEQETRAVTAGMLLTALPALLPGVCDALARSAAEHPDEVVRRRAGRRLAGMLSGVAPPAVRDWPATPGELRAPGLRVLGAAGERVPEDALRDALGADDPVVRRTALYAAGMTGDPVLARLAGPQGPPTLRAGARWWLAEGGRVGR